MILTGIGLLVVLVEILILQKNTRDILSISKLRDRTFSKMWLIVCMADHSPRLRCGQTLPPGFLPLT